MQARVRFKLFEGRIEIALTNRGLTPLYRDALRVADRSAIDEIHKNFKGKKWQEKTWRVDYPLTLWDYQSKMSSVGYNLHAMVRYSLKPILSEIVEEWCMDDVLDDVTNKLVQFMRGAREEVKK